MIVDEVRRILAGQSPTEVRPEDQALVEGYRQAMEFVLRRADDAAFQWTRELIVALHHRALAGRYDAGREGCGRTSPLSSSTESQESRSSFLRREKRSPPCGRGVLADGRGSAASSDRLWMDPCRCGRGPLVSRRQRPGCTGVRLAGAVQGRVQTSRVNLARRMVGSSPRRLLCCLRVPRRGVRPSADVTSFLVAHLEAQLHEVRSLDNREKVGRQIWTALKENGEDANLDRRVANAVWDAFFGRDVTAGYYRSLTDVSPATAAKDLAAVPGGLLRPEGRRRGRRYLPTERLYELAGGSSCCGGLGPARYGPGSDRRRTKPSPDAYGGPRLGERLNEMELDVFSVGARSSSKNGLRSHVMRAGC